MMSRSRLCLPQRQPTVGYPGVGNVIYKGDQIRVAHIPRIRRTPSMGSIQLAEFIGAGKPAPLIFPARYRGDQRKIRSCRIETKLYNRFGLTNALF